AVQVPPRTGGHDLPAMAAAIPPATRLVCIATPNNPTGTWFERAEFEAFMASVPEHVLVVLDEAYTEYVEPGEALNGFDYIERYPNLIVCRTLSKAHGQAALRVGYCICPPQVADVLNRGRAPINAHTQAPATAHAAHADDSYLAESRQLNRDGMRQLEQGLTELGLQWIPSRGNFIAVDLGRDAGPVYQGLLRAGVIVRPVAGYEMPNHLRVSIGLREENQRFLEALAGVLAQ